MQALQVKAVLTYGRLADFIRSGGASDYLDKTLPLHVHGAVYAFCISDARDPEFEGEFVEAVSSTPGPGPMRFQSRRRDLHWHFISTKRTGVIWRTAHGLATVTFAPGNGYAGVTDRGTFVTRRMLPMKPRQIALERARTGDRSLTSAGIVEHAIRDWDDPRIGAAFEYARWCRQKRVGNKDKNVTRFLNGEPCKNLIYFIAFRQPNDPIAHFLVYVGQTQQTFESRMQQHFEAHATLADTLCAITPSNDMIAFVLDIATEDDDLDTLEAEAIEFFSTVSAHGANMIHGHQKNKK